MKIEVNITKTKFFIILITLFILGSFIFVFAYSNPPTLTNNPAVYGHSVDEIDWSQFIPQVKAVILNSSDKICLRGDCKTAWPSSGSSIILPLSCTAGSVLSGISASGTAICTTAPTTSSCTAPTNGDCLVGCAAGKTMVSISGCYTITPQGNNIFMCQPEVWKNPCLCSLTCG